MTLALPCVGGQFQVPKRFGKSGILFPEEKEGWVGSGPTTPHFLPLLAKVEFFTACSLIIHMGIRASAYVVALVFIAAFSLEGGRSGVGRFRVLCACMQLLQALDHWLWVIPAGLQREVLCAVPGELLA